MNSQTERLTVVEKLAQLDEVRLCKFLLDYCFFLGAVEIATDADWVKVARLLKEDGGEAGSNRTVLVFSEPLRKVPLRSYRDENSEK